jgi:sulfur carrier protein ThiS
MLELEVHLHGDLDRYVPDSQRGVVRRALPEGAHVGELLASFGFPPQRRVIVGVDGRTAALDEPLVDGARIDLVPPIAGGAEKGPG